MRLKESRQRLKLNAEGSEGELVCGQDADAFEAANGAVLRLGRNNAKKVPTVTLQAQGFAFEGAKE